MTFLSTAFSCVGFIIIYYVAILLIESYFVYRCFVLLFISETLLWRSSWNTHICLLLKIFSSQNFSGSVVLILNSIAAHFQTGLLKPHLGQDGSHFPPGLATGLAFSSTFANLSGKGRSYYCFNFWFWKSSDSMLSLTEQKSSDFHTCSRLYWSLYSQNNGDKRACLDKSHTVIGEQKTPAVWPEPGQNRS